MPKVNLYMPQKQREIEQDLRDRYGATMSAIQVSDSLGIKSFNLYREWLADVPAVVVGKRKRYRAQDVAAKMYGSMENLS